MNKFLKCIVASALSFGVLFSSTTAVSASSTGTATPTFLEVDYNNDGNVTGIEVEKYLSSIGASITKVDLSEIPKVYGGFTISNPITLTTTKGKTLIDLSATGGSGSCVVIKGSNITLENFTIYGSKVSGLTLREQTNVIVEFTANNAIIRNNDIKVAYNDTYGNESGIGVLIYGNATIVKNNIQPTMSYANSPIYAASGKVTIDGNKITGMYYEGIMLNDVEAGSSVKNNTIDIDVESKSAHVKPVFGLQIARNKGTMEISNNTITVKPTTPSEPVSQIKLADGAKASITNNKFNNGYTVPGSSDRLVIYVDNSSGGASSSATVSGNNAEGKTLIQTKNSYNKDGWYEGDVINSNTGGGTTYTPYIPPNTTDDPYVYEGRNTTNTTNTTSNTTETPKKTSKNAVITANNVTITVGDKFTIMSGVKAVDNGGKGKNITNKVTTKGTINTSIPGKYTVTYRVTGENGKTVTKKRTVTVKDKIVTGPQKCNGSSGC